MDFSLVFNPILLLSLIIVVMLSSASAADLVVAQDGTGNFSSIKQAVDASLLIRRSERLVIHIKAGVYYEYVKIAQGMNKITLLGDGIGKTIITGNKSTREGYKTFQTATVSILGDSIIAKGISIVNTASPFNHQAVALLSQGNKSVFYQCSFEGYQDTLYAHTGYQFYRECDIYGTIDFIFGNAAVVIQNSTIYVRYSPTGTNVITAQGRKNLWDKTGISIHDCHVTSKENLNGSKTYLGRPWEMYSRTVFIRSYLDGIIDPNGWLEWNSSKFALNTLYYAEFDNKGPGSLTANRVKWRGYHTIDNIAEAQNFTVAKFIDGESWLPDTGVPFTPGL